MVRGPLTQGLESNRWVLAWRASWRPDEILFLGKNALTQYVDPLPPDKQLLLQLVVIPKWVRANESKHFFHFILSIFLGA